MRETDRYPVLFAAWDIAVRAHPIVAGNVLALWAALSWLTGRRRPELRWPARILIGALSALAMLFADLGHAVAHIASARLAGAPMDEIYVAPTMSRTVYWKDDIPPQAHRTRALGGPAFSVVGLAASLLFRSLTPPESAARVVAEAAWWGHGLVLGGSLLPLPFVDGGSILKWTLVERGQTPEGADAIVRGVDLALGTAATTSGIAFAATRRWLPGLGLIATGVIAIGAALDRIR